MYKVNNFVLFFLLLSMSMAAFTKTQDLSSCDQQISDAVKEIAKMPVEKKVEALEDDIEQSCWQKEAFKVHKLEYLAMQGNFVAAKAMIDSFDLSRVKYRKRIKLTRFAIVFDGPQKFDPGDMKAFEYANDLVLDFPKSYEGYMLRGAVYARWDKFEASLADYKAALSFVKPQDKKIFDDMEVYYSGLFHDHDLDEASYRIVRSYLNRQPTAWSNSDMVLRTVTSALVIGENEEAAKIFRELLRRNPSAKKDVIFEDTVGNLRAAKAMNAEELNEL